MQSHALAASVDDFGNMSSGTATFVLDCLMRQAASGAQGCATAFGQASVAKTMCFRMAG